MKKYLLLLFCLPFAMAACNPGDETVKPDADDPYTHVKIGQSVPAGSVTDITGTLTYNTMQRDSAVVIYMLWSECQDCHRQTPELLSLTDADGRIPGVKLVCVARGGTNASLDQATAYWASFGRPMPPLYYDPDRAFYNLFASQSVPRLYFVDRSGVVRHASAVVTDAATIARFIDDIR